MWRFIPTSATSRLPPGVEPAPLRLELVVYDGANLRPLSVDETGQPNLDLGPLSPAQ